MMRIDGLSGSIEYSQVTNNSVSTTSTSNQAASTPTVEVSDTQGSSKPKDMSIDEMVTQLSKPEKNSLPVSEKFVLDAVEKANKAIANAGRRFEYSVHEKTKQVMIKVINKDSNEIVREIPSEKMLDMFAAMLEKAGLLVDEKR